MTLKSWCSTIASLGDEVWRGCAAGYGETQQPLHQHRRYTLIITRLKKKVTCSRLGELTQERGGLRKRF